jgi:hypothetical protein
MLCTTENRATWVRTSPRTLTSVSVYCLHHKPSSDGSFIQFDGSIFATSLIHFSSSVLSIVPCLAVSICDFVLFLWNALEQDPAIEIASIIYIATRRVQTDGYGMVQVVYA